MRRFTRGVTRTNNASLLRLMGWMMANHAMPAHLGISVWGAQAGLVNVSSLNRK
jgi:hypothetical protein